MRYLVDPDKISHNIAQLRQCMGEGRIYAVVKADGYGLGSENLARICAGCGLRRFAVSDLSGARAVRACAPAAEELLLLRPARQEEIPELAALGVTFTVASRSDAERLDGYGVPVHIKVDTGLGRRGFRGSNPDAIVQIYRDFPNLRFAGIYTHFADVAHAPLQFRRFTRVLKALEAAGIDPGVRHCCNSAAALRWEQMRLDGVRVGSALLGRVVNDGGWNLRRTGVCQVPIESLRVLDKGCTVGYGSTFRIRGETTIALCPIGIHNGFGLQSGHGRQEWRLDLLEQLRGWSHVLRRRNTLFGTLRGRKCPVLGRVSTEAVTLDVTGVPCREGDIVEFELNPILLRGIPVEFGNDT